MSRLDDTTRAWHTATHERISATTQALTTAGATNPEVIEALELLRASAHRELDDLIDDAQTQLPPAGLCWRARRYHEPTVPHRD